MAVYIYIYYSTYVWEFYVFIFPRCQDMPDLRLAAGVGSGNSTVDHACKIGRILGSVTWNALCNLQISYNMLQLSILCG